MGKLWACRYSELTKNFLECSNSTNNYCTDQSFPNALSSRVGIVSIKLRGNSHQVTRRQVAGKTFLGETLLTVNQHTYVCKICICKCWKYLELVSAIFYKKFIFNQMIALTSKKLYRYWDIQFFVFLSCPLFLPVSHCIRGCLKINLKVYDVINCLNKNFITHFVWYLGKKKRCAIETLFIGRVLNNKYFYGQIMQKMCNKSQPETPF